MANARRKKERCVALQPVKRAAPRLFLIVLWLCAGTAALHAQGTVPAPTQGPTVLTVAEQYVKIVGGVVAVVSTVLGAPVAYLTFRKTRAEIAKINLEADKLRREVAAASGAPGTTVSDSSSAIRVYVEGEGNSVTIVSDPRLAIPMLLLMDIFVAGLYFLVAKEALRFLAILLSNSYMDMVDTNILDNTYIFTNWSVFIVLFFPLWRSVMKTKRNFMLDGPERLPAQQTRDRQHT